MLKLKNQSGFTAIEGLLILVIVAILGGTGFYVVHSQKKTNSTYKAASQASTATPKFVSKKASTQASNVQAQNSLMVKELGITLVNVPVSIKDLDYAIIDNNSKLAGFSTTTLSNLDKNCSPTGVNNDGLLSRYSGTYNAASAPTDNTAFVKQLNGFWIAYSHPESVCSDNASAESLHTSQTATFQAFATDPANIEAL